MSRTAGSLDSLPLTPYVEYLHSVYEFDWPRTSIEPERWISVFDRSRSNSPVFIADDVNGELSFSTFTSERDFYADGPFHSKLYARPDNITTRVIFVANGERSTSALANLGWTFDIDPSFFHEHFLHQKTHTEWPRRIWERRHQNRMSELLRIKVSSSKGLASVIVLAMCRPNQSPNDYTVIIVGHHTLVTRQHGFLRPSTNTPTQNRYLSERIKIGQLYKETLQALNDSGCREGGIDHPCDFAMIYFHLLATELAKKIQDHAMVIDPIVRPDMSKTRIVEDDGDKRYTIRWELSSCRTILRATKSSVRNMKILLEFLESQEILQGDKRSLIATPLHRAKALLADFGDQASYIEQLILDCNLFLQGQMEKLALAEARSSVKTATSVEKLSYLGFLFVPLSLSAGFFGVNVKQLGQGDTELWVFIVTAISIALFSIVVLSLLQDNSFAENLRRKPVEFLRHLRYNRFSRYLHFRWQHFKYGSPPHSLSERTDTPIASPEYQESLLLQAAVEGNNVAIQSLIEEGVNVGEKLGEKGDALQVAVSHNNKATAEFLTERGADVNAQCGKYGNALQIAAMHSLLEVVELLLNKGADVDAQGGELGTALQAAASGGHQTVVQKLLDRGAKVNAQGGLYGSALQAARMNGHTVTAELLLERGAEEGA